MFHLFFTSYFHLIPVASVLTALILYPVCFAAKLNSGKYFYVVLYVFLACDFFYRIFEFKTREFDLKSHILKGNFHLHSNWSWRECFSVLDGTSKVSISEGEGSTEEGRKYGIVLYLKGWKIGLGCHLHYSYSTTTKCCGRNSTTLLILFGILLRSLLYETQFSVQEALMSNWSGLPTILGRCGEKSYSLYSSSCTAGIDIKYRPPDLIVLFKRLIAEDTATSSSSCLLL